MNRPMLLVPLALSLLLAVACARAPKPAPTLPPELKKQEAQFRAVLDQAIRKVNRGEKITNPNEACLLYLYGAGTGDDKLLGKLKNGGADINAHNLLTQDTPLQMAVLEGSTESAARLLKLGADPNLEDSHGSPPLYVAVGNDKAELTRLLLEHGADPNKPEKVMGTLPLMCATLDGKVEIMALLLEHGANPNAGYPHGGATALHMAAMHGHKEAAQLLLKHGANPNARTAAGTTPLKAATTNNKLEVIDILKKNGAQ